MSLSDLNHVVIETKRKIADSFRNRDVQLSGNFKTILRQALHRKGDDVSFYDYSTVVKIGQSHNDVLISNQWFYLAYFVVDYFKSLNEYKSTLMEIKNSSFPAMPSREYNDLIKNQKDKEHITQNLDEAIDAYFGDDNESSLRIKKFLTEYSWWNGQKTIDRHDYYESPVLNIMGVVNNSHSYMADIIKLYAASDELLAEANTLFQSDTISLVEERVSGGKNIIIYGAPGTGKSRFVQDHYENIRRVVFHPDYLYSDFVGTYKPTPIYRVCEADTIYYDGSIYGNREPLIDYSYVPGPFIKTMIEAWMNPEQKYTLLIEELNRANAAAVFGDIFQLLDRNQTGYSEYKIMPSNELRIYLKSISEIATIFNDGIYLPSNMDIVATMNSADQGVYVIDSAFKRRWNYKYIPLLENGFVHEDSLVQYGGREIKWKLLLRAINKKLKMLKVNEDRLIGPYFISPDEITDPNFISEKLYIYLWDDVLRHRRGQFFSGNINSYSELIENHYNKNDVMELLDLIEPESVEVEEEDDDSEE